MPRCARVGARILGLAVPLVAGCVSAGVTSSRVQYQPEDFARLRDSVEAVAAQRAGEPRVHIITPAILGARRFVESAFRVNEDAYVVVVAVDYDGFARVVFPESPTQSGFARANVVYQLPEFFAGFGAQRFSSFAGSHFSALSPSFGRTSGLIFAVASERPLQLQRLATDDGAWDEYAIERLLWARSFNSGAYALGNALSLTGQRFDTEFSGFTQGHGRPSYMFAQLNSRACDAASRSLYDEYYQPAETRSITYVAIGGIKFARIETFDACSGQTSYQLLPMGPVPPARALPADSTRADSSGESRIARSRYVGAPVDSASSVERPVARRGTIGRAGDEPTESSFRRPMIDRTLRFLPPERVRDDGRIRGSEAERPQEDITRERQVRRAAEERERRTKPPRQSSSEPPARAEPSRPEPTTREVTSPSTAGAETTQRSGRPVKD